MFARLALVLRYTYIAWLYPVLKFGVFVLFQKLHVLAKIPLVPLYLLKVKNDFF
jgi:hypothetical protein